MKVFRILIVILLLTASAFGQNKEELQKQKVLLQDQIDLANTLLKQVKSNRESNINQLQTLNQKINAREQLIRTMNGQIKRLNLDIISKEKEIVLLEVRLDSLKTDYAKLIDLAQQNLKPADQLMFILSSSSFTQALKRIQYFKDMTSYRERQVNQITNSQIELAQEKKRLIERKQEKLDVQEYQEKEKNQLLLDAKRQEETLISLKNQVGKLKNDIQRKKRKAEQLEKQIKRIIAEELRKSRLRAERDNLEKEARELGIVKGKDFNSRTSNKVLKKLIYERRKEKGLEERDEGPNYAMTPESRALANDFASNKGALPWPVERGLITGKFGKNPHPVVKGVLVDNPHIEISTERGAIVRATFEGEVSSVVPIPGANIMVLIRHGNYFTVYSNLISVQVNSGDLISFKQPIGTAFTDEEGKTMVQFGIWKDANIQNPDLWLSK